MLLWIVIDCDAAPRFALWAGHNTPGPLQLPTYAVVLYTTHSTGAHVRTSARRSLYPSDAIGLSVRCGAAPC